MSESSGFTDLRIGYGAQGVGDDSVWPAFTDVMAVIVMIFLMALVIIILKNYELDRRLISTTSDKEQAAIANENLQTANTSLEQRKLELEKSLSTTDRELASERLQVDRLVIAQRKLNQELSDLNLVRQTLEIENSDLSSKKLAGEQEILRLEKRGQDDAAKIQELSVHGQTIQRQVENLIKQLSTLELESSQEIASLTEDKQTLGEKLHSVSLQLAEIKLLFEQAQISNKDLSSEVLLLTQQFIKKEKKYEFAEKELAGLRELIQIRTAEITDLQSGAITSDTEYQTLETAYAVLDEKFRKLIRPARSEAGKQVVQVYYDKKDEIYQYRLREPGQANLQQVTKAVLEAALQRLKDQYGTMLYVRIIIPDASPLTHHDAWKFTEEILGKYDYYH